LCKTVERADPVFQQIRLDEPSWYFATAPFDEQKCLVTLPCSYSESQIIPSLYNNPYFLVGQVHLWKPCL
ncbi:hypothetical protein DRQ12_10410, partial [candidate division KSB1 bacterium]